MKDVKGELEGDVATQSVCGCAPKNGRIRDTKDVEHAVLHPHSK
jgi:hypothetical protein